MEDKAPILSKKARMAAIARARGRLDARFEGDELWNVINDYDASKPNAKTESRATALVLGAIVEQGLEVAILSHCIDLDEAEQRKLFSGGEDGPMNFAVKIRLGFALGIYGAESRDDLDLMRHIRNLFAHEKRHLTFADEVVIALCDQIKWIDRVPWNSEIKKPTSGRRQFIETTRHFFMFFHAAYPDQKGKPISYLDFEIPDLYG